MDEHGFSNRESTYSTSSHSTVILSTDQQQGEAKILEMRLVLVLNLVLILKSKALCCLAEEGKEMYKSL